MAQDKWTAYNADWQYLLDGKPQPLKSGWEWRVNVKHKTDRVWGYSMRMGRGKSAPTVQDAVNRLQVYIAMAEKDLDAPVPKPELDRQQVEDALRAKGYIKAGESFEDLK